MWREIPRSAIAMFAAAGLIMVMLWGWGCASLPKQTPQQIAMEAVIAAELGIRADHDFGRQWLNDADFARAEQGLGIAREVIAENPPNLYAAIHSGLQKWEATLSTTDKLRPYFDVLIPLFG